MYVLIVALISIKGVAVSTVPGFTSYTSCKAAGEAFIRQTDGWNTATPSWSCSKL